MPLLHPCLGLDPNRPTRLVHETLPTLIQFTASTMATESQTPRITWLHVRTDCNGCEHKIRKTLRAIHGVREVYIDQANHKITVVGIAEPERIVKAIRKIKRVPTVICPPTEPAGAEAPPPPAEEEASPPPAGLPVEAAAPVEPVPEENNNDNEAPAAAETPVTADAVAHRVQDHPFSHGHHQWQYRDHYWASHPVDAVPHQLVTHSYSHHRPGPAMAESGYLGSPVPEARYYSRDYYPGRGKGDDSQIISMFSDENPNACIIV